jgi:hypothetical protein
MIPDADMFSFVVCTEAEPAYLVVTLRGWKTARVSRHWHIRQVGLFFKQGFGLTEKVQYEIGRGSYVFGAPFCSGAGVYAAM